MILTKYILIKKIHIRFKPLFDYAELKRYDDLPNRLRQFRTLIIRLGSFWSHFSPILRIFRSLLSQCSLIVRSFGPLDYSAILLQRKQGPVSFDTYLFLKILLVLYLTSSLWKLTPSMPLGRRDNLPYLDMRHPETDTCSKNYIKTVRFNVGFQPYAGHDMYHASVTVGVCGSICLRLPRLAICYRKSKPLTNKQPDEDDGVHCFNGRPKAFGFPQQLASSRGHSQYTLTGPLSTNPEHEDQHKQMIGLSPTLLTTCKDASVTLNADQTN